MSCWVTHAKFCMETDLKHTYKFCMKYPFYVNNYKHGVSMKLWCYMWDVVRICTDGSGSRNCININLWFLQTSAEGK